MLLAIVIGHYDTFDPCSIVKLGISPLNVLVDNFSVLLQCELCVVIDFMDDKFLTDFLLFVECLLKLLEHFIFNEQIKEK